MVWMSSQVDKSGIYNRTSACLNSIVGRFSRQNSSQNSQNELGSSKFSAKSDDSAIFLDEENFGKTSNLSRSSSVATSVCSCVGCLKGGEWVRRPSRLLENSKVDDYYKFDAILGEGSFSTVYLGESISQKGGWVAIKVVDKIDLLKTKEIGNPGCDPDQDSSETESNDNGNTSKDSSIEEDSDPDSESDLVSMSMRTPRSVGAETGHEKHSDREIMRLVDKEIRIMSFLDHPHVIHLEEVYEDDTRVCFVMELAQGGEVFDRLIEKVAYDEMQAVDLLVQLLCAVSYLHDRGIVHRDLKLENLLYYDDTEDSKIMVADFGLSDWIKDLEDGSSPICGTPGYMAPEVIRRQACTPKADVWSIGVIAYILLAGYPPFYIHETSSQAEKGSNEEALLRKIVNADYQFHPDTWQDISPEAISFIRSLMTPNPKNRPTCQEALAHPWLNNRHNLEKRKRRDSSYLENPKWTAGQQAAFIICVFIIICSYSALITYVFNITKPVDLMQDLKLEFLEIYDAVFYSVDHWSDHIFDIFCKGVHYLCPFVL